MRVRFLKKEHGDFQDIKGEVVDTVGEKYVIKDARGQLHLFKIDECHCIDYEVEAEDCFRFKEGDLICSKYSSSMSLNEERTVGKIEKRLFDIYHTPMYEVRITHRAAWDDKKETIELWEDDNVRHILDVNEEVSLG